MRAAESSSRASSRAEILAGRDRTVTTGDRGPGAVRAGVAAEQVELVADDAGQRADRSPAASSGCAEERALGLDRQARVAIVDGCGHREHPLVVGPDLDGDRTLPRGRRHDLGLESLGDPVTEPHPVQSRAREHERVGLTRIEPAQSRVDVAVEWMNDEIRPPGEQEARPPRAVGPDATTRRQIGEPPLRRVGPDDERVAGVGPGQVGGDAEPRILVGRNVLRAVDRDVDGAIEQRPLDRGDEGSLAPRRVRRSAVAVGLDDHDPARMALAFERFVDQPRLGQRQRAAPRSDRDLRAAHRAKMSRIARPSRPSVSRPRRSSGSRSSRSARCRVIPSIASRASGSRSGNRRQRAASSASRSRSARSFRASAADRPSRPWSQARTPPSNARRARRAELPNRPAPRGRCRQGRERPP